MTSFRQCQIRKSGEIGGEFGCLCKQGLVRVSFKWEMNSVAAALKIRAAAANSISNFPFDIFPDNFHFPALPSSLLPLKALGNYVIMSMIKWG